MTSPKCRPMKIDVLVKKLRLGRQPFLEIWIESWNNFLMLFLALEKYEFSETQKISFFTVAFLSVKHRPEKYLQRPKRGLKTYRSHRKSSRQLQWDTELWSRRFQIEKAFVSCYLEAERLSWARGMVRVEEKKKALRDGTMCIATFWAGVVGLSSSPSALKNASINSFFVLKPFRTSQEPRRHSRAVLKQCIRGAHFASLSFRSLQNSSTSSLASDFFSGLQPDRKAESARSHGFQNSIVCKLLILVAFKTRAQSKIVK